MFTTDTMFVRVGDRLLLAIEFSQPQDDVHPCQQIAKSWRIEMEPRG